MSILFARYFDEWLGFEGEERFQPQVGVKDAKTKLDPKQPHVAGHP